MDPQTATLPSVLLPAVLGVGAAGVACVAYGMLIERRWYRERVLEFDILTAEATGPVDVLHLSDLHFVRRDRRKAAFLAERAQPDVAIVTGDFLAEPRAVERAVAAVRPLRGRLASYYVLGSNDYFAPQPLNYSYYFRKDKPARQGVRGRGAELQAQLEADGWVHLKNRRTELTAAGVRFEVVGMDDAHIERHDLRVAPRRDPGAFGLAVVHSPDPAPELAALGYDLIVAGHTHGGQVRLPFVGALVTNSQLPARLCRGASRMGPSILHVSPGLGTSKYAPFRFLCRPEVTRLILRPKVPKPEASAAA
ncbi:MAG TPA: metallophosphoesterase [Actinobacteria bacterium]|nr:metallophosphoesterase [Actinomycetota bacterium]